MRNEYETRYGEIEEEREERPRSSSRRRTSDDTEKKVKMVGKIIDTKLLNVRSTPENSGTKNIVGQLKNGEKVTILETVGDYYKISYKKTEAYILSKFCELGG